jgi:hypothetical protein
MLGPLPRDANGIFGNEPLKDGVVVTVPVKIDTSPVVFSPGILIRACRTAHSRCVPKGLVSVLCERACRCCRPEQSHYLARQPVHWRYRWHPCAQTPHQSRPKEDSLLAPHLTDSASAKIKRLPRSISRCRLNHWHVSASAAFHLSCSFYSSKSTRVPDSGQFATPCQRFGSPGFDFRVRHAPWPGWLW